MSTASGEGPYVAVRRRHQGLSPPELGQAAAADALVNPMEQAEPAEPAAAAGHPRWGGRAVSAAAAPLAAAAAAAAAPRHPPRVPRGAASMDGDALPLQQPNGAAAGAAAGAVTGAAAVAAAAAAHYAAYDAPSAVPSDSSCAWYEGFLRQQQAARAARARSRQSLADQLDALRAELAAQDAADAAGAGRPPEIQPDDDSDWLDDDDGSDYRAPSVASSATSASRALLGQYLEEAAGLSPARLLG
ncbi:hypothetical protein HXX76_012332 [Chlamydomonas incerta]|uniref:Uncharacterized protein n=1 Tax=Chlamydomonas incerta TaxID=51695 RepID=A0A835SQ46_CHLIN|nr:hypothetical protein HXX76_012332 [Chlamydomonas incerta]|eukprot:KAG2427683.1 hypothetical protein HXX76_012332 [Chlamydomonas incerta]